MINPDNSKGQSPNRAAMVPNVSGVWSTRASELAATAFARLVIDQHNWFSFRPITERKHGLVLRKNGNLTQWTLQRHFVGEKVGHLIAIPASAVIPSYHQTATWGWIGFDIHPAADKGDSWEVTQRVGTELSDRALAFLIEDYGGEGNYHIWIPLRRESREDMEEARGFPAPQFAEEIISAIRSPFLSAAHVLPLPGRHHTVDKWSRFWGGSEWLEGEAAIHHWLAFKPGPLPFPKQKRADSSRNDSQTSHEELEETTPRQPTSATVGDEIIDQAKVASEDSETPESQRNETRGMQLGEPDVLLFQPTTSEIDSESIAKMPEGRYTSFSEKEDRIDQWEAENYAGRELDATGGSLYFRSSRSCLAHLTEIHLQVMPVIEIRVLHELAVLRAKEYGQLASRERRIPLAISAAAVGTAVFAFLVIERGIQGLFPSVLTLPAWIGAIAFAIWTSRHFRHWLQSKHYVDPKRIDQIVTQAWKWRQIREVTATALTKRTTPN